MSTLPTLNAELLRRHERPGPRYTSYPSAPQFTARFGATQLREWVAHSNAQPHGRALSLYVHIPFCESPCFYCGCNRVITRDAAKGAHYTERVLHEIRLIAPLLDPDREVVQLHLGGGTPNFLGPDTLTRLLDGLQNAFHVSSTAG